MELLILQAVMFVPALLGFLIPYITEFVTNSTAHPRVKSAVNIALSLLLGVLPTIAIVGGAAGLLPYFVNVLAAWLLSGRLYLAKLVTEKAPEQDQL